MYGIPYLHSCCCNNYYCYNKSNNNYQNNHFKSNINNCIQTTVPTEQIDISNLVKGDINEDGKFTKKDLILLNEYIAEPVYIPYVKRYIIDVNNDYTIDERDSVYLLKIINKGN